MAAPKQFNAAAAGEKWSRVTPTRQQDYQTGVQGAAGRYQDGVNAAGPSYDQGVQTAISQKRYEMGVSGKGQKYATNASSKGAPRWAQGVSTSRATYEQGVGKVAAAVNAVNLPPKQAKGSPANLARVQAVVEAERAVRGHHAS